MKYWSILLGIAVLSLLSAGAAGTQVTMSPGSIRNGEEITIAVRDLAENASFSLLIESQLAVQPASDFSFQLVHFTMPFTLKNSAITVNMQGTDANRMEVWKGDTIVTITGKSQNGSYTTTRRYDITQGTYDRFQFSGTSAQAANQVIARLQVAGQKTGPSSGDIRFVVDGIPSGAVVVTALVDGSEVMYDTVQIGSGPAAGLPTPVNWTSPDGKVALTAQGPAYVGILPVQAGNLPPEWVLLAGPYTFSPENITFDPPAALSFPGAAPSAFVARYEGGRWTPLNGTSITGNGVYALVAARPTTAATTTVPTTTAPATAAPATTRAGLEGALAPAAMAAAGVLALRRLR
jgi:hypothetical protein